MAIELHQLKREEVGLQKVLLPKVQTQGSFLRHLMTCCSKEKRLTQEKQQQLGMM